MWETSQNRTLKLPHFPKEHALKDFSFAVVSDVWNYPLCTRTFAIRGLSPLYHMTQEEERRERRTMRIGRIKKTRYQVITEVHHSSERM